MSTMKRFYLCLVLMLAMATGSSMGCDKRRSRDYYRSDRYECDYRPYRYHDRHYHAYPSRRRAYRRGYYREQHYYSDEHRHRGHKRYDKNRRRVYDD